MQRSFSSRPVLFGVSLLGLLLSACPGGTGSVTACDQLCDALVEECGYAAFPSYDSCLQGCGYNQNEGADTEAHLACVDEASCDTFGIIECENQFGANSDD